MAESIIKQNNDLYVVKTRADWNDGQRVKTIAVNWTQTLGMHLVIEVESGLKYYVQITSLS